MSVLRGIVALAAMAGIAALAGCGNRTDQGMVLKGIVNSLKAKGADNGQMTPEQTAAAIQTSLANIDLPLALAVVEDRRATAILVNIETNGAYRTWGTSDRRTVTTARGMVTATRGLGNDLMSSAITGTAGLIAGRKAGSGSHVLRFLDGENRTYEIAAQCEVNRGGAAKVSGGELRNVAATQMTEACTAGETRFTNSYLVDGRGRVVQSRQWLGQANGYITLQLLR